MIYVWYEHLIAMLSPLIQLNLLRNLNPNSLHERTM